MWAFVSAKKGLSYNLVQLQKRTRQPSPLKSPLSFAFAAFGSTNNKQLILGETC